MEEQDWNVLESLAVRKAASSADIAAMLGIDVALVNASFKVLYAAGYLQYADRSGFGSGGNELTLARVTGQGIFASHQPRPKPEPTPGDEEGPEQEKAAPQAEAARPTSDELSALIDAQPDLSQYERDDLKAKLADLEKATAEKESSKADQIRGWLAKHAPWLASALPESAPE